MHARLGDTRGLWRSIAIDDGSEFEGQVLGTWASASDVQFVFICPGTPKSTLGRAHLGKEVRRAEREHLHRTFNGKFRASVLVDGSRALGD